MDGDNNDDNNDDGNGTRDSRPVCRSTATHIRHGRGATAITFPRGKSPREHSLLVGSRGRFFLFFFLFVFFPAFFSLVSPLGVLSSHVVRSASRRRSADPPGAPRPIWHSSGGRRGLAVAILRILGRGSGYAATDEGGRGVTKRHDGSRAGSATLRGGSRRRTPRR